MAFASAASAADTVTIGLQEAGVNGGAITNEGSSPTSDGVTGLSYGSFVVNNIDGTAPAGGALFDTAALDVSGGTAGVLNVYVTASGITSPTGLESFLSTLTSNALSTGWTVTEKTFLDAGNGIFATTTPLSSNTFSNIGTDIVSQIANTGAGPYSVTEEYTITSVAGPGAANDTIDLSVAAVPEPATWAMMLLGVFGIGAALRSARNRQTAFAAV
jgi:hypothetical protein